MLLISKDGIIYSKRKCRQDSSLYVCSSDILSEEGGNGNGFSGSHVFPHGRSDDRAASVSALASMEQLTNVELHSHDPCP